MELTDIMTLVKAGYTKDEISQMEKPVPDNASPVPVPASVPAPEGEPVPAQVGEPAPVAQPVPEAQPQPQPAQAHEPTLGEVMQSIARLTSAIQANAIANSAIPAGLQNIPKAEDMLAEIIRPTFKERGT